MEILLGLVAAFFWGAGDFLARYATHRIGTYRTLFFMQFVAILGLTLYLLVSGQLQHLLTSTSWQPWVWAIIAALLNIISSLALYRAFEIGKLALVSPIASGYAAITILLAAISGEALTQLHGFGLWTVLLGVILAATPLVRISTIERMKAALFWHSSALHGIVLAILASLGYGTTFWVLAFHVTPQLGGIVPVWVIRCITPCVLAICAPLTRQSLRLPHGRTWLLVGAVSILDTVAYLAYASGTLQGQVAIVTMLSSLYSAVTVVLAWLFLREKLQGSQWCGIIVIFIGITLLNL